MTICPANIRQRVVGYLHERFGLEPLLWESWQFYQSSRGRVHLGPILTIDTPRPDVTGCLIARVERTVKPSTALFQLFGRHVQREIIDLDRHETRRYFTGQSITVDPTRTADCRPGFVMLRYERLPLACGLLRERDLIENQLPRSSWCQVDLL
jgi:NOL1/NOP2/fmu family ribosome biogenesis protein